jgi:lipoprotein-anchoring transpeptidase ErfK/SrfK
MRKRLELVASGWLHCSGGSVVTRCLLAFSLVALPATGAESLRPAKRPSSARPSAVGARSDFERTLRLQIFLDEEEFGPGLVDGRAGEFTRKAIAAWNRAHGHGAIKDDRAVREAAAREVAALYAVYKIKSGDLAFVTPAVPDKPEEQAAVDYLGYRSLGEFVAERYHTSEALLARLNPQLTLSSIKPGTVMRVPNVEPFAIEALRAERAWSEDRGSNGHSVVVDVRERTAEIHDANGRVLAFFPITPGEPKFVPLGEWKIEVMTAFPRFRWDKQMLEAGERSRDALMLPPGPNSPVGILWAGLNRSGIGLHGTATPETIGRSRSHGCIRFANWDAVRLPRLVRPGARVVVH